MGEEAKVNQGGTFTNSRFEELSDIHDIARCVARWTGIATEDEKYGVKANFGLEPIATIGTERATWIADEGFRIVAEASVEQQKRQIMQEMDDRIEAFMKRYTWAFSPGKPKGKLTAYFEWKSGRQR
ncbi:hypothetical protein Egran_01152 [Elaphomyces granulatus]|uniref:Uncharacterized protein n=1 Tax=Elaphomyces granulatus TaxID=519963 RepID=A0A232M425_9EURO|nr:hypothetical protein Egran_01152 [Elaphomyces granulatus]